MRALFFLIPSLLCHGALYAWAMQAFPGLRARRRLVLAVFGVLVFMMPVGRLLAYRVHSAPIRMITAFAMAELLVALIALVPIFLLRMGIHVSHRVKPAASPAVQPTSDATPAEAPRLSRREAFERAAGLAVVGGSAASIGWGVVRGRLDFQIEEVVVRIPGLPKSLEGYTIAQVSDIHVGMFVDERELAQGLGLIARTKPDVVVATGDLVDFDPRYVALMARSLGDLRARDGVVAILGNHDYYTDGEAVREGLRRAGVRPLVNEHLVLRPRDGSGVVLAGVDDYSGKHYGGEGPNLGRALAGAPPDAPRILLAHQPQYFGDAQGKVALQLSGHVHGGQVNPIVHPARYLLRYVAGRYEGQGSTMWVNRGFGTAGPPARLGAPPEITRVVLVSA